MPEYDAYSVYYDLLWASKQDDVLRSDFEAAGKAG